MAVAQHNIMAGLYAHLTGDNAFNTALGGSASVAGRLYHATAPRGATTPYVVATLISSEPRADVLNMRGYAYRIQFSIFDADTGAAASCIAIADALRSVLHRATFTVTGHKQMNAEELTVNGPMFVDDAWAQYVDYSIRGFTS